MSVCPSIPDSDEFFFNCPERVASLIALDSSCPLDQKRLEADIIMHSWTFRLNAIFTFTVSALGTLSALNVLSVSPPLTTNSLQYHVLSTKGRAMHPRRICTFVQSAGHHLGLHQIIFFGGGMVCCACW
jgi:hypothetical protein